MGLPLGWYILSLLHIFLVEQAFDNAGVSKRVRDASIIRIQGDDLFGFWPHKVAVAYDE